MFILCFWVLYFVPKNNEPIHLATKHGTAMDGDAQSFFTSFERPAFRDQTVSTNWRNISCEYSTRRSSHACAVGGKPYVPRLIKRSSLAKPS